MKFEYVPVADVVFHQYIFDLTFPYHFQVLSICFQTDILQHQQGPENFKITMLGI